jgi:hypothetical protein
MGLPYNGRYFAAFDECHARQNDVAHREWEERKDGDLKDFWPRRELSEGLKTHGSGIPNHGYTHYWTMFSPRQLLVLSLLLKVILNVGKYDWEVREFVLGAFQQYLRNQSMFCFWDISYDKLVPHLSNNYFFPYNMAVENCIFPDLGRGNWASCAETIFEGLGWATKPWDLIAVEAIRVKDETITKTITGKSTKVYLGDTVLPATPYCATSTDLKDITSGTMDLVITDPPFGGILQYAELSDFFYVWLRLALKDKYPDYFSAEYTPKAVEVVANPYREKEDPDGFYKRLLTQCWTEAHRILKPGGILAFTFHHNEDQAWISVLESLFDAGFTLSATYPIRSDETKGDGQFGSQKIEFDIIHVCRKHETDPQPISWAKLRREITSDVAQLKSLLENHAKQGLLEADLQVIKRGKALEHFSRHYGKVFVDDDNTISVKDALLGINQMLDEGTESGKERPPGATEPIARQFLLTFGKETELQRDQLQKFLKGSITSPDEFKDRGWCVEKNKVFSRISPLDFAKDWVGKHKRRLTSDLDQALVLIGACFEGSGINATDTLKNDNFKPKPSLKPLLDWHTRNGADSATRAAAMRALSIFNSWESAKKTSKVTQPGLFGDDEI